MLRVFTAIGLVALSGMAIANPLKDRWLRYELQDVTVNSQLDRETTERNIRLLRAYRGLLKRVARLDDFRNQSPVNLVIFKKRSDFVAVTGQRQSVGFFLPEWRHQFLVAGPQVDGLLAWQVVLHEYTHYMLLNALGQAPPAWYQEGLAEVLPSMRISDGRILTGLMTYRVYVAADRQAYDIEGLLQASDLHNDSGRYVQAWALIHYLLAEKLDDELHGYVDALMGGEDPVAAFVRHFSLQPGDLNSTLRRYARGERRPTLSYPIDRSAQRRLPNPRTLTQEEVVQLLGSLSLSTNPKFSLRAAKAGLKHAPEHPGHVALRGAAEGRLGRFDAGWASIRGALEAAPSPNALLDLADLLEQACRSTSKDKYCTPWVNNHIQWRKRAYELAPMQLQTNASLGYGLMLMNDPENALHYLKRAKQLAPWSHDVRFHIANAYAQTGQHAEAAAELEHVLRTAYGNEARLSRANALLQRLNQAP